MSGEEDVSVLLPSNFVRRSPGVALRIGSAGGDVQVVYRGKEDWAQFTASPGSHARVRFASLPSLAEALAFVQEQAEVTEAAAGVCVTGGGATQDARDAVAAALGAQRVSAVGELDCLEGAMEYIQQHVPRNTSEYRITLSPQQTDAVTAAMSSALAAAPAAAAGVATFPAAAREFRRTVYKKLGKQILDEDKEPEPEPAEPEDGYPGLAPMEDCMEYWPHVMAADQGDAVAVFKGTNFGQKFVLLDKNARLGSSALAGLGALLVGAKSGADVLRLAGGADGGGVHGATEAEAAAGAWRGAAGKQLGDFSQAEVAAALVDHVIDDTVTSLMALAASARVGHVFVAGGPLASDAAARASLTAAWYRRGFTASLTTGQVAPQLHVLRQGPHLAALGAFINSVDAFFDRS